MLHKQGTCPFTIYAMLSLHLFAAWAGLGDVPLHFRLR